LFGQVSKHLTALEGKTVNLSDPESGTHALAVDVLAFAGLYPRSASRPQGYVPMEKSRQELLAEKDPDKLPDAVLVVSSFPTAVARHVVARHNYRLVPIPFAEAFCLEALGAQEPGARGGPAPSHINKGRTYPTTIPAFTCSVEPPVPQEPVPTVGTRLLLVAHKDVDPQAVRRLVEATLASKVAEADHPPLDARVLKLPPECPWHEGTRLYQEHMQPVVYGVLADWVYRAVAILAAAVYGLFTLWQWGKMYGSYWRDKGFGVYIQQVARIEEQAREWEQDPSAGAGVLLDLREELCRLKTEALDRFTKGELAGHGPLATFLAQVNGARDYVTRLIEHRQWPGENVGEGGMPAAVP
jgi:hypothetical protein